MWEIVAGILSSILAAGSIILGLSSWLGKVWATRLAENERAKHALELESFRNQLSELTSARRDLLMRQREVYTRIATAMRVFLDNGANTPEERADFLSAYDEFCLWASENPVQAIAEFLDLVKCNTAMPGTVNQEELRSAYERCMTEMRKDAGFPDTNVVYRVVGF